MQAIMRNRSILLLGAVVTLLSASLEAQACGVKGHFNLFNCFGNQPGQCSDIRIDTPWTTTAPLTVSNAGSVGNGPPYSFGNGTTISDYGFLRAYGSGEAAAWPNGNGTNLFFSEWTGAEPLAQFTDTLLVVAPGLAPGTPVQLRASLHVGGFSTVTGPFPWTNDYRGTLLVNGSTVASLTNTNGVQVYTINTQVGQSILFGGRLFLTLRGQTGGTVNPVCSYNADVAATYDLTSLTPGVALQSCSGAAYNGLAARVTPVGVGCGAAPPVLAASVPTLGGTVSLSLTGAPANAAVMSGFALGRAANLPFGGCVLQLDPGSAVLNFVGTASATGQQQSTLTIPSTVNLLNFRLTAQALPLVSNGPFFGLGELSNGVELQIGY